VSAKHLIIGGAGFIGTNVAEHAIRSGHDVIIYDNFSRYGSEDNARWLAGEYGSRVQTIRGDIRERDPALVRAMEEVDAVYHLAAQVAVTLSVDDPRHDFETNALGTFNVLEAVRASARRPALLYSSTNKVYGKMADVAIIEAEGRHTYADLPTGVSENQPLEFYSPYGCSKGTGDQYVLDYARIYGLKTVVFRQSCIYGPHQFGIEDQGWVAWFSIRALQGQPVTIYGDGKQVRDVLYIDDLTAAYEAALRNIDRISGRAYNIGGGPAFTMSLLELLDLLEQSQGIRPEHRFADWRPGDQLVYISDIRKAEREFGWTPRVSPAEGVGRLIGWLSEHAALFAERAV
jgi:CDP-paratose 2-epimerase